MNDERLVSIPNLTESCTSTQAIAAARELAAAEGATTGPWQVATDDGLDPLGRSVRWEARFDLPEHRQELVVTVSFPVEEGSGRRNEAVASLRRFPFPSEGSELARMARDGQISGRRLRAVWRQQVREHEPLPRDLPDSSAVAVLVAPDPVRVARARITRMRGFVWIVTTPGQTRHLRLSAFE
ncbi:MAG: hypothetical protein ACLGHX_14135 [Acidimicrobiia bacterium]